MSLIKYIAIAALVLFGVVLALIGILSVTHDTPVHSVIAIRAARSIAAALRATWRARPAS